MSRMTKLERAIRDALEAGEEMTGEPCSLAIIGGYDSFCAQLHRGMEPSEDALFAWGDDIPDLAEAVETLVVELSSVRAMRRAAASGGRRAEAMVALAQRAGIPSSSVVPIEAPARGEA